MAERKNICPKCGTQALIVIDNPYRDYTIDAHELELPIKRLYMCVDCEQSFLLTTPQSKLVMVNKAPPPRFKKN